MLNLSLVFRKYWDSFCALEVSEKLLLLFVLSLPFERVPTLEINSFTLKTSLFFGSLLILASLKKIFESVKEIKFFVIPLLLLITNFFIAENKQFWIQSTLILAFNILAAYAVFVTVGDNASKALARKVVKTLFVTTLIVIIFGIFQWLGDLLSLSPSLTQIRPEYAADKLGLPRMHSTFLEPLYFGLFLLLPLGLSLADRANQLFKNIYYRFGFIALIYGSILFSLARGAIVASAFMGLTAFVYNFKELKEQLNAKVILRVSAGLLVLSILIVGAVSLLGKKGSDSDHNYSKGLGTIIGHLETIRPWGNKKDAEDQNSINSRDEARSEAWKLISSDSGTRSLGVGVGQYGVALNKSDAQNATSNFVLLDLWAEYGFIVTFALLLLFLSLILQSYILRKEPIVAGLGLFLVGYLVQSITFGEISIIHFWFSVGLLIGVLKLNTRPKNLQNRQIS